MDENIKNYLGVAMIFGIFLVLAVGFWYVAVFSKSVLPERQFSVNGEGKVVATPDIAQISFGVLTQGGKNLADLQKQNSDKANSIIAFLKESGIEAKDIKTEFYNISPRYQSFRCPPPIISETEAESIIPPCRPAEIVGYSINQSVSVKIRDLNKTGDILEGVVGKGANNLSGPIFTLDEPTQLRNQARQEAINKARETALATAKAGGFRLGKLISIQEGFYFPPYLSEFYAKEVGGLGGDTSPIIEPGSQEIRVNVTLIYEIR